MNVKIIGTGSYLPKDIITNEEIAKEIAIDPIWVYENLGIKQRHVAINEVTSDLAAEAGQLAIENAGISNSDVDLLIIATATPDKLAPSTACMVQSKLETRYALAYDISAVCCGFLFALIQAAQLIDGGFYKTALVIGADTFSTITDWKSKTCTFFGDGAGAVVLQKSSKRHFLGYELATDGTKWDYFVTEHGDTFTLRSKELFEFGCSFLPPLLSRVLDKSSLEVDDIDMVVSHQASIKLLRKICELSGVDQTKLQTNMETVANTAGATIPILLDTLNKQKLLLPKTKLLLMAMGSGMTYGGCVYVC